VFPSGPLSFGRVDLSAFYFDIRKDALYVTQHRAPRAARTVPGYPVPPPDHMPGPVLVFHHWKVWLERFPGRQSSINLTDIPENAERLEKDDALACEMGRLSGRCAGL